MIDGFVEEEITTIGDAPPKHERVNDYEPKEPTAEELKLAGVTLVGLDPALIYLKCDRCGDQWATTRPDRTKTKYPYWICQNVVGAEP
jgi:hypothetical protein